MNQLIPHSKKLSHLAGVAISCGAGADISNDLELFDFNEYLTAGSDGVFYVRVVGDSMEAEIYQGDLLVVNRNLQAKSGDKVLASVNGCFTIKIFVERPRLRLVAANTKYKSIEISRRDDFQIFGVITHIVRKV